VKTNCKLVSLNPDRILQDVHAVWHSHIDPITACPVTIPLMCRLIKHSVNIVELRGYIKKFPD